MTGYTMMTLCRGCQVNGGMHPVIVHMLIKKKCKLVKISGRGDWTNNGIEERMQNQGSGYMYASVY